MKTISNIAEYNEIISGNKPVILDFYADWCGPCQALLPVLEAVQSEYPQDVVIAKINVDHNSELAKQFNVRSIPSVFFMKDKNIVDEFKGLQSKSEIDKRVVSLVSLGNAPISNE